MRIYCQYCDVYLRAEFAETAPYCSYFCKDHAEEEARMSSSGALPPPRMPFLEIPPPADATPVKPAGDIAVPFFVATQDIKSGQLVSVDLATGKMIPPSAIVHGRVGGAIKDDDGKLPLELLPFDALEAIADVLKFGASKYVENNWRGGFKYSRIYGALLRHVIKWWRGEDKDPESGLSHLAHAGCCVLFLIHFTLTGTGTDNRKENNA